MFPGFNGRSRPGVGMVRPHQSRTSAKFKPKSKDAQVEAKNPDPEELRSLRAAYYGGAPNARKPASSVAILTAEPKNQPAPKERVTTQEHKRRGRNHKSSSSGAEGHRDARRKSYSRRRTEEYVYGLTHIRDEDRKYTFGDDGPDLAGPRRISEATSSSRRSSLSTVAEDDIMPGDSVSQNGRRRAAKREHTPSTSRPPLTRRSTAPAEVTGSEDADVKRNPNSTAATSKTTKQSSSIFGSLLRRNTTTSVPTPARLVECLTCGSDDVPVARSAKLECGHRMCNDCLRRLFQMSVKDPAHMPPKCCTDRHIPLRHVERLFDLKFKVLWNRKYQECHTRDRVYCPISKCGEWIKPAHFRSLQGRKYAICPRCKTKVCTLCNSKMHKSQECPKDPDIAKLVEQAKEEGWQTCFNCRAIVERREGCNHMTCRCQAEFCIVCGLKWKTCDCPWFNYSGDAEGDPLNDTNMQERIQVFLRRAPDAVVQGGAEPEPEQAPPAAGPAQRNGQARTRTLAAEIDQRRRQERSDAALARRLQLASIFEPNSNDEPPAPQQQETATWGVGNAQGHLANTDFVQNAADVVVRAFGDRAFGLVRADGRRRGPGVIQRDRSIHGPTSSSPHGESALSAGPAPRTDDGSDEAEETEVSSGSD